MPRLLIPALKFVGTVSLGLFTGISFATSTQSLPSLLSLPAATDANSAYQKHRKLTIRTLSRLAAISISTYTLAFWLAPAGPGGGRHPYLIWTSLTLGIAHGFEWVLRQASKGGVRDVDIGPRGEVNGEQVRSAIEKWQVVEAFRTGISGLAFMMGVVGIWGDGFAVRSRW